MNIEPIWYEYSPYVYAAGGVASLSNYGSYIAIASGVMLIVASGTILRMRIVYRKKKAEQLERDKRAERVARRKKARHTDMIIDDGLDP